MISTQIYSWMSAAAYDERRGSDTDGQANAIESHLNSAAGGQWDKIEEGTSVGWNNPAGASYSDEASGMQADVWTNASGEIVIVFRGTEASRGATL